MRTMKSRMGRLKRFFFFVCMVPVFSGGCYLFLSISCNILLCSPQESAKVEVPSPEEVINEEKLMCSLIKMKKKRTYYPLNGSPQLGEDGPYSVIYNYIPAIKQYKVNETLTYSTHATTEFVKHIKELSHRWDGPVSVAVYVPGYDFCSAITQILRLRNCESPSVKYKVSWHLFWDEETPPAIDWTRVDTKSFMNCSQDPLVIPSKSWHSIKGLSYPVNVGRNVARKAATTWFILPSDVELIPSRFLAQQFMAFIGNTNFTQKSNIRKVWPRIYVVPVFEVQNTIPQTKEELLNQISMSQAVYFHRYVCAHCQRIPGLNKWLQKLGHDGEIHAFSSVKRVFPFHRWEPIFICTNNEPLYDERLSWEGLQDKMSQMHELCLLDYNLVILDRAFLVHSPGIKRKPKKETTHRDNRRDYFIQENSKMYDTIMDELQKKWGTNVKCRRH